MQLNSCAHLDGVRIVYGTMKALMLRIKEVHSPYMPMKNMNHVYVQTE